MAIKLVPKEKISKKLSLDFFRISIYLLGGLALGLTAAWAFLYFSEGKDNREIGEIDVTLEEWRSKEMTELEEKVVVTSQKISLYEELLESHKYPTYFFDFIAKVCHKHVYFLQMEMDSQNGEVLLSGKTENFSDLRKQMLILRDTELIREVVLDEANFAQKGGVEFVLSLEVDGQVFKEEFITEAAAESSTEPEQEESAAEK